MMSLKHESQKIESAISLIQELTEAKVEAEAQIANCTEELSLAKERLASVITELKSAKNNQQLRAVKEAWQASIEAFEASIEAYQADIDACNEKVAEILQHIPEARRDH